MGVRPASWSLPARWGAATFPAAAAAGLGTVWVARPGERGLGAVGEWLAVMGAGMVLLIAGWAVVAARPRDAWAGLASGATVGLLHVLALPISGQWRSGQDLGLVFGYASSAVGILAAVAAGVAWGAGSLRKRVGRSNGRA